MKHILIVIPFFKPNIGGVETRFDDICRWLSRHGFKVKVITYKPITTSGVKAKGYEQEGNVEIFRMSWPGYDLFHKLQRFVFLQTVYTSLGLLIRVFFYLCFHREEIEVVHAAGFNCALIAKILCKIFKIKWVMSTHAIYEFKKRRLLSFVIGWILKDAHKIIAISKVSQGELVDIGISPEKIIIHTTWVDQNLFKPLDKQDCRKKLNLEDKFTVVFVGRLRRIKGVLLLLEVAESLAKINFVFVGEGPLEGDVKSASARLENILYAGQVNNKKLAVYYNAADLSVMPSLYKEPFGRVVLESLSCGIPCICSNLGGIVDYLNSSVAYLVEPKYEILENSIMEAYENREKLQTMASKCRRFAKENFSEENMLTLLKGYGFKPGPRGEECGKHSSS